MNKTFHYCDMFVYVNILKYIASGFVNQPGCDYEYKVTWEHWVHAILYAEPQLNHNDVIKWKHFPRYWPFVRGIHRSPVNSPHKGQWRGALKFSLICARINGWVNNREAGDLRCHQAHCDVIVMMLLSINHGVRITPQDFGIPSN